MTVEVIRAVAWPTIVLVALIIVWRTGMMAEIGRRVTRVSVFQVSLELATATARAAENLPGLDQLRDPVSSPEFASNLPFLMEQLMAAGDSDYAVIDLRDGNRWLASRLFIFVEMLQRQRGLKCVVFVQRHGGIGRRLVGIADPLAVKWALASYYPWLEAALNQAYGSLFGTGFPPPAMSPPRGSLEPSVAALIVTSFMNDLRIRQPGGASPDPSIGVRPNRDQWVSLTGQPPMQEHSQWLDGARLADVLGSSVLREDDWLVDDPKDNEQEQTRQLLARSGDFVAIVNTDRSFRRLVERRLILERIAHREARGTAGVRS